MRMVFSFTISIVYGGGVDEPANMRGLYYS